MGSMGIAVSSCPSNIDPAWVQSVINTGELQIFGGVCARFVSEWVERRQVVESGKFNRGALLICKRLVVKSNVIKKLTPRNMKQLLFVSWIEYTDVFYRNFTQCGFSNAKKIKFFLRRKFV